MSAYPSTENLYERDPETHKLTGVLKRTDFGQVYRWLVTEKVDGTNIRIVFQRSGTPAGLHGSVEVKGRTDAASLPGNFVSEALPDLSYDRVASALAAIDEHGKADAMVIYGEGYGPGIQKGGGDYGPRKALRVFDVVTYLVTEALEEDLDGQQRPVARFSRGLWRTFRDVEEVAEVLGMHTAPMLGVWTTAEALDFVRSQPYSRVAVEDKGIVEYEETEGLRVMEGVVARTDPYLYDYRGNRVLWKLKGHDLP